MPSFAISHISPLNACAYYVLERKKDIHSCNQSKTLSTASAAKLEFGQDRMWWDHIYCAKVNDDNVNSEVSDKKYAQL